MWLIWRHRFGEFLFAPFFGKTGPRSWCFHIFFWLGQVELFGYYKRHRYFILDSNQDNGYTCWLGRCLFFQHPILAHISQCLAVNFSRFSKGSNPLRIVSNNLLEAFDEDFGKTLPNLTVLMAEAGWTAKVKGGIFQKQAVVYGWKLLKNHFHPYHFHPFPCKESWNHPIDLKQPFLLSFNFHVQERRDLYYSLAHSSHVRCENTWWDWKKTSITLFFNSWWCGCLVCVICENWNS